MTVNAARVAARAALTLRHSHGVPLEIPLPVFDFATDRLTIEVRFVDAPSLDGLYVRATHPVIMVAADRPTGRQAMTCAHEIGHHVFGHGKCLEAITTDKNVRQMKRNEFLATTFAGFLMMPRPLVLRGFRARGLDCETCAPEDVLLVAGWIGVGYTSLVDHMRASLSLISEARASCLKRRAPTKLRSALASRFGYAECIGATPCDLFIYDEAWVDRPLDLQVGDVVVLRTPQEFEGRCCELSGNLLTATAAGIGRLMRRRESAAVFVRVRRRRFEGLAEFRHLEEPE